MPGPREPRDRADAAPGAAALAWTLVAAWIALVWWLGSSDFSAPITSRYLVPFLTWLLPFASPEQVLATANFARKLGHPVVYAVLAGLAVHAVRASGWERRGVAAAAALGLVACVAGLDELRQAGVASRTGSAGDVALDLAGGALAVAVLTRRGPGRRGA